MKRPQLLPQSFAVALSILALASAGAGETGQHLFILSGQSNMAQQRPQTMFTPFLVEALGAENVTVVHDAQGGQPIRRWYKGWQADDGEADGPVGDLYDRLMAKVKAAIDGERIETVTFIWMQGESDASARYEAGTPYEECLRGLMAQNEKDLGITGMYVVIGRISDYAFKYDSPWLGKRFPYWMAIRETQVSVCKDNPRWDWVDTDDFNGDEHQLHYTKEGRMALGKAFADKALELLQARGNEPP